MLKNLNDLYNQRDKYLLFETLVGSRAYGTFHATSDEDLKGVFILPAEHYLMEKTPLEQVSDDRNDLVYYTLKRFLELASNANPNIIEMLFMPGSCIRFQSDLLAPLFDKRHLFITKKAYKSHVNYAQAQIKKARGKNKWVNNPQPEKAPEREDFCWIITTENNLILPGKSPLRPISLSEAGVNLKNYNVSKLHGKLIRPEFRKEKRVQESVNTRSVFC